MNKKSDQYWFLLGIVDTAPGNDKGEDRDGYAYQRSQRFTNAQDRFLPNYRELLDAASVFTNVQYEMTTLEDLMRMSGVPSIIEGMIKDHARLGPEIAPDTGCLAVRKACPHSECGLAEESVYDPAFRVSETRILSTVLSMDIIQLIALTRMEWHC